MDRRQFVAGAGAGVAAAASAFPSPRSRKARASSKMVTTWPKTLPGLQSGAERVAQSITALSGGRLNVKVFAAGQLVGAFKSFDAVSSGLADMYHSSEITWAGRSAAFSYFCNVPFGLTAAEINAWVYYGGGQALWDELSAGFGLKPFMCGNTGPQMGGWFTKELTGVESYKGLRYRMPGVGGEVLRRLGAVVVNLPGRRDHPVAAVRRDRCERIRRPVGGHGAGSAQGGQVLLLSRLPRAGSGDFARASTRSCGTASAAPSAASSRRRRPPRTRFHLRISPPTTPSRSSSSPMIRRSRSASSTIRSSQALGKMSGEVLDETSRKDDLTRRVYDSFIKFRTAAVRWGDISERAFLNARALPYPFGG